MTICLKGNKRFAILSWNIQKSVFISNQRRIKWKKQKSFNLLRKKLFLSFSLSPKDHHTENFNQKETFLLSSFLDLIMPSGLIPKKHSPMHLVTSEMKEKTRRRKKIKFSEYFSCFVLWLYILFIHLATTFFSSFYSVQIPSKTRNWVSKSVTNFFSTFSMPFVLQLFLPPAKLKIFLLSFLSLVAGFPFFLGGVFIS